MNEMVDQNEKFELNIYLLELIERLECKLDYQLDQCQSLKKLGLLYSKVAFFDMQEKNLKNFMPKGYQYLEQAEGIYEDILKNIKNSNTVDETIENMLKNYSEVLTYKMEILRKIQKFPEVFKIAKF